MRKGIISYEVIYISLLIIVELNGLIVELSNVDAHVVVDDWVAIAPPKAPTVCATVVVEIVLTIRAMADFVVEFRLSKKYSFLVITMHGLDFT